MTEKPIVGFAIDMECGWGVVEEEVQNSNHFEYLKKHFISSERFILVSEINFLLKGSLWYGNY